MFVVYMTICDDNARHGVKFIRLKEFKELKDAEAYMNEQRKEQHMSLDENNNVVKFPDNVSYTIMME